MGFRVDFTFGKVRQCVFSKWLIWFVCWWPLAADGLSTALVEEDIAEYTAILYPRAPQALNHKGWGGGPSKGVQGFGLSTGVDIGFFFFIRSCIRALRVVDYPYSSSRFLVYTYKGLGV